MLSILLNFLSSPKIIRLLPFFLIAILIYILVNFYRSYKDLESQVSSYRTILEHKGESMEFKDDKDKWHSKLTPIIIDNSKVLKELVKSDSNLILLKNQITGLKKDMRNLVSATVIGTSNSYTIEGDLKDSIAIINDTLKVLYQKLDKVTPWLEEHIEIINGKYKSKRTIYDTIFLAAYVKRKWFLGKQHIEAEAVSRNPDNKIFIKTSVINKSKIRKAKHTF